MYHSYFGLKEAPFSIAVNPRYLYMSPSHRDALAHLLYGVGAGGGFIVLTGEVGTGKTTINRCLIDQLPENADLAIILNPALDSRDLLATVCDELQIEIEGDGRGLKVLTDALHAFLLANHARGRKTVLMIDEAQHLDFDVLEQIRLLTNLETDEEKLLHIILIGQPELAQRLARPELRQLNQRVTARFDLTPLTREETAAYIRHRLHVAGMPAGRELFDARLLRAIHRESGGVPRLINLLCDRLLLGAYGRNRERPDRALLARAAQEVLGEAGGIPGAFPRLSSWRLPAVVAAAIVIVAAGFWAVLAREDSVLPSTVVDPGAASATGYRGANARDAAAIAWDAAVNGRPPGGDRAAPRETTVAERPAPENTAAPAVSAGLLPREQRTAFPVSAENDAVPAGDAWFLSPREGARLLATLYGLSGDAPDPCEMAALSTVQCTRADSQSWTRLLDEPRPALLALLDSRRFEGRALLLGIDDDQALLATASSVVSLPLVDLGQFWTGEVWRFWQRPPAIQRTLSRGDSGADVAAAAELFARLDGQPVPLSDENFDARLEERVRLFQRDAGLAADGVLGERTLRSLVLAAGEDMDLTAARARFSEQLSGGGSP